MSLHSTNRLLNQMLTNRKCHLSSLCSPEWGKKKRESPGIIVCWKDFSMKVSNVDVMLMRAN